MPSTSGSGPSDPIDPVRRSHEDTRPDMLRLLVHEFLKQPIRTEAAEARFVTLAIRLIEAVEVPVAAKHVRELAPHPAVPRALALYLATGPLSLAGPILRLSPVLDENDLTGLAERAEPSHLAAMAARRDVSPALAKRIAALVHRGSEQVAQAPVSGSDIPPSETPRADVEGGEAPAPMPVEIAAREQEEQVVATPASTLGAPPAEGVEIELADIVAVVVGTAAGEAAPASLAAGNAPAELEVPAAPPAPLSSAQAPAPVPPPQTEPTSEDAPSPTPAAALDTEPAPADTPLLPPVDFFTAGPEERTLLVARLVTLPPLPLAERPATPPPGFIDALLDAAKATGTDELATLLERTLGATPENAARIVADATGQSLAVAARALGLSFAILSRVLFRLHPVTGRSAGEMSRLAEMFDSLPLLSAQHLAASWRAGRRIARERPEDTPSMRSYAGIHANAQAVPDASETRRRNS